MPARGSRDFFSCGAVLGARSFVIVLGCVLGCAEETRRTDPDPGAATEEPETPRPRRDAAPVDTRPPPDRAPDDVSLTVDAAPGDGTSVDVAGDGARPDADVPDSVRDGNPDSAPADGGAVTSGRSKGCGRETALKTAKLFMDVAGENRHYFLRVPPGYDRNRAYPLVFGMPGHTRSANDLLDPNFPYKFDAKFGKDAIIVYPNGAPVIDAAGKMNGYTWTRPEYRRDIAFVEAIIDKISDEMCVDTGRIALIGHSSGAWYVHAHGCEKPARLRLIAATAGGLYTEMKGCGNVAVMMIHSPMDRVVAYKDGLAARDYWLGHNGCSTGDPTLTTPSGTKRYDFKGWKPGTPVVWWEHWEKYYCGANDDCSWHGWPSFATQGIWDYLTRTLPPLRP